MITVDSSKNKMSLNSTRDVELTTRSGSDLGPISNFFKQNFFPNGEYGSQDLFEWKINKNPNGVGLFKCIEVDGELAAITSIVPKSCVINQASISAAEIGDSYTAPKFQRRGFFAKVGIAARINSEDRGASLIFGFPNKSALPGWLSKSGFSKPPNLDLRQLSLVISPHRAIRRRVGWFIADLVSGPIKLVYAMRHIRKSLRSNLGEGVYLLDLSEIPPNWDNFWEKCKKKYEFIFERSTNQLKWRYNSSPNHFRFLVLESNKKIKAVIIYSYKLSLNGSNLIIADFLSNDASKSEINEMLLCLYRGAREHFIDSMYVWCVRDSIFYESLLNFGFRDIGEQAVIINKNSDNLMKSINIAHITIGDSDNV